MRLIFVCTWNKNKEKTWSGTTYYLNKTLKSKISVQDINIKNSFLDKFLINLLSINFHNYKIKFNRRFSRINSKINQKNLNRALKNNNKDVVLQIGDYGTCKNNTYVYQDLSIDSLLYFKQNKPQLFQFSGFENESINIINERRKKQLEFYNNAKGIFTMSKWLKENLINYSKIPKEKVHYIGAGINLDTNKIKVMDKTSNKILFVGRDFYRKGGDITYNAFKILKEKYLTNAELFIIGPKQWPLKDMIEGVSFLGDINSDELSYYFNICDIFCMPSRFEAYGLVFVEALVYGLPCIARNERIY